MTGPTSPEEKRLGPYILEAKLGQGGMGIVFLARHAELGRLVALKCLLGEAKGELIARFRREAEAAIKVVHPGLARIYDFGEDGGHVYMAMEYVRGSNLQSLLEDQGKLPLDEVIDLARQLLRALEACHAAGLIHRDLKPANIMVDDEGVLKVMDLGLVHMPGRTLLTQEGQVLGTPRYWPPEMVRGDAVDQRADLYQAGLVLHELLEGRSVFHGLPIPELAAAILTRPPPPPPQMEGPLAPRMAELLARLMAREPADRFASARDAAAFLNRQTGSGVIPRRSPAVGAGSGVRAAGRASGARSGGVQLHPGGAAAGGSAPAARASLTPGQVRGAGSVAVGLVVLAVLTAGWRITRPAVPAPGPLPTASSPGRDVPRGASASPGSTTPSTPPPPLSAVEATRLVEDLTDAVKYTREVDLSPELDDADAKLRGLSDAAERVALTGRLHARWRNVIAAKRFSSPLRRFQERAKEAWACPHLNPEARAMLLFRVRELALLVAKLERRFGLKTGFDLERLERPYLRPHAALHAGGRPWLAWTFGDGGRAAGRALPAFGVTSRVASPVGAFSGSDLDKLIASNHGPLRRLTIPLDHPLPQDGARPAVHLSFRMAGGMMGESLTVRAVLPGTPEPLTLAALVPFTAVDEGCLEVDARLLENATALELLIRGRPLELTPGALTIDYLVAWLVPAER